MGGPGKRYAGFYRQALGGRAAAGGLAAARMGGNVKHTAYGRLAGTGASAGVAVPVSGGVDGVCEGVIPGDCVECETSIAARAAVDIDPDATVPPKVNPPAAMIAPYASPPVTIWSTAKTTVATMTTHDIIKCGKAVCRFFM